VLTLRAAGELLANANSIDTLSAIAAVAGCAGDVSPLDADTRRTLGLEAFVLDAAMAPGEGARRALLVVLDGGPPIREWLARLAARLASRTPHVLWLVVASGRGGDVALAAWSGDRRPPKIGALVAQRAKVVDSDAETLRALASVSADHDVLAHARWVEILGRDALSVRFFRALDRALDTLASSSAAGSASARREIALLQTSRLLFLSFLEAKGWLDGDRAFIAHRFDACMLRGGRFHERVLRPLFFGTLNTPLRRRAPTAAAFGKLPFLNGGLFSRTAVERRNRAVGFSDDAYGQLIASVFGQYRFTAREETASWNEAAIDPEMLGRAFESLMASTERRRTGAYYTPFALVERVADAGLDAALGESATRAALEQLTILDPACGSGAFLVHALERVSDLLTARGDWRAVSAIRRDVLTRSIHGVDINPTAVWLCELRLWLSVAIESSESDPTHVLPLPNLDRNIRVGDSLSGSGFGPADADPRGPNTLATLRQRYARSSGARKESLSRQLDRAERRHALEFMERELASIARRRRDLVAARRGRDLFGERYRPSRAEQEVASMLRKQAASIRSLRRRVAAGGALPFAFATHFADVAARGGFELIVGNPPWVRLHNVAPQQRAEFRRRFDVARTAAWEPGAVSAGAGRGFAAQVDVSALFVERSIQLLASRGSLALLLPVKLWRSLAGGGVRRLLGADMELSRVEDFADAPGSFDAAVYPSLVVATRPHVERTADEPSIDIAVHRGASTTLSWRASASQLAFDDSAGAPWLLLPPDARRAFDRIRHAGRPLAASPMGRPLLGVKCGFNDAFIVRLLGGDDVVAEVESSEGRRFAIERSLLRPLLRGEHLRRWRTAETNEHIIWTHDRDDVPLKTLPPLAARWFAQWRRDLSARSDARHRARWWSLFRTDGARHDGPRVAWCDVGREPRACLLAAGETFVPLNSCYVVRCRSEIDARALCVLLNGPLARAWLDAIAEPARGGYRRYLGWTTSLLPVPHDWDRARALLAPVFPCPNTHAPPSDHELLDAALRAYELPADAVAPLVAWSSE
jgi:Eco57I restriction-modification methylase